MLNNLIAVAERCSKFSLAVGYVVLLCGMLFVERGHYKTLVYISLVLPAVVCFLINIRCSLFEYLKGCVLWFFISILLLSLSVIWGDGGLSINSVLRRCALYFICGYGLFYLYHYHFSLFLVANVFALSLASAASLWFLYDYYAICEHPLSTRFLIGLKDCAGLFPGNYYGSLFNPLLYSHLLVFYIVMSLGFLLGERKLGRGPLIVLWMSFSVFFLALIVSQTRMAWLVVSIIFCYELFRHFKIKGLIFFSLFVLISILGVLLYGENMLARGDSGRIHIWREVLYMISDMPFFGHGIGSSIAISPSELQFTWHDTHNIYLALLYFTGVVGLVVMLTAIWRVCREARIVSDEKHFFILWLLVLIFGGMTDGDGLFSRPSEHWFNLILPSLLMLAFVRSNSLRQSEYQSG